MVWLRPIAKLSGPKVFHTSVNVFVKYIRPPSRTNWGDRDPTCFSAPIWSKKLPRHARRAPSRPSRSLSEASGDLLLPQRRCEGRFAIVSSAFKIPSGASRGAPEHVIFRVNCMSPIITQKCAPRTLSIHDTILGPALDPPKVLQSL